jgi:hypothetical protein
MFLVGVGGAALCGVRIHGAGQTLMITALLLLVIAGFYRREDIRFRLSMNLLFCLFSAASALLSYLAAIPALPLCDSILAHCDEAMGFCVPRAVVWQITHPLAGWFLTIAYDTAILQIPALILLLDKESLERFMLRLNLSMIITLICFLLLPAEGPFVHYNFCASISQAAYLDHLHAARSGLTSFDFGNVRGLITFPSYHTIAALLIVAAVWSRPYRGIFLILNAAVVITTLTSGWHYLADVLGGIFVVATVCAATRPSRAIDTVQLPRPSACPVTSA